MPMLIKAVFCEENRRKRLPTQYRPVYVAQRLTPEHKEILERYYMNSSARARLQATARSIRPFARVRARRILEVLDEYDRLGLCTPWKVWWQDQGHHTLVTQYRHPRTIQRTKSQGPQHPLSTIQYRTFKRRGFGDGNRDITGGLAYWVSDYGRTKNQVLHKMIDDILIEYLADTVPMWQRVAQGELTQETAKDVQMEIERRADEAIDGMLGAYATYSMLDCPSDFRPDLATLGDSDARRASAEGHAREWLGAASAVQPLH